MYAAIVFLPIIASAIAGLFGRVIGARASELVTTGLLFVSAALSVVAFNDVALQGHKYIIPILPWIHSGAFVADWTVRVDSITAVMVSILTVQSATKAPEWIQGRMGRMYLWPCSATSLNATTDRAAEANSSPVVTSSLARLPMTRPNRPAMALPAKGMKTIAA